MKKQADKHRSERQFKVGELVYLKVQPYIQTSVATRMNQKLAYRYFGPFKILQRVCNVAYKLDLPDSAKIHPVVHVSQLKKHVPPAVVVSEELPDPDSVIAPLQFNKSRVTSSGTTNHTELLVSWSRLLAKLTT